MPHLTMHKSTIDPSLKALLIWSAVLLVFWSLAVPVFEAPDEPDHWQFARYLHQNRRLPLYGPDFVEANQPPLYYLLIAPLAFHCELPSHLWPIDSKRKGWRWFPRYPINDFSKYWPIRTVRLVTAFISLLTVLFCYLAGSEATGDETTGLLAAGLTAFLPQFTFRGMNVSNDALVTMTCAATVYLIVRLIRRGFTWPVGLLAAMTAALASLSKINAIFLPIPLSLAILSESAPWRTRFSRLAVLGIAAIIVAPWLLRNQLLYGDPFASRAMWIAVADLVDPKPIISSYFFTFFPYALARSFVGVFGWMNISMPEWVYQLFGLLALLAIVGYIYRVIQRSIDTRLTLILLTAPLLSLLIAIHINLTFSQPQGRFLFPALTAIALLVAIGLEGIPGWSRRLTNIVLGILTLVNFYVLYAVILPTYWTPPSG